MKSFFNKKIFKVFYQRSDSDKKIRLKAEDPHCHSSSTGLTRVLNSIIERRPHKLATKKGCEIPFFSLFTSHRILIGKKIIKEFEKI